MRRFATILLALGLLGAGAAWGQAPELDCLIKPEESVTLSFAVEGVVEEVLVDRGDFVEQGQIVARLRADAERASLEVARARAEAQAQLQVNQARLEFAERERTRNTKLQGEDIVSQGHMDEVLRDEKMAKAALLDAREAKKIAALEAERAAAILEMRTVRSPVNGVVVERILSPGEWADPPQILKVAQIDPLRVEAFAPLALFGRVSVGTKAEVMPEDPIGGVHAATVQVVDRVIDAASGTFKVRLELPNPDYLLPAGVRCRVRFPELAGEVPPQPDAPQPD